MGLNPESLVRRQQLTNGKCGISDMDLAHIVGVDICPNVYVSSRGWRGSRMSVKSLGGIGSTGKGMGKGGPGEIQMRMDLLGIMEGMKGEEGMRDVVGMRGEEALNVALEVVDGGEASLVVSEAALQIGVDIITLVGIHNNSSSNSSNHSSNLNNRNCNLPMLIRRHPSSPHTSLPRLS